MCAPPHRNSIGKSKGRYKRVVKSGEGLGFVTVDRGRSNSLYIVLIYLSRDSHRFFIVPNLIDRLQQIILRKLAPTL
jgi:hypothetical protein